MKTIAADRFERHCLRLLDEVVASGEPLTITKGGKPIAQLTAAPVEQMDDWAGAMRGIGEILGDLVAPAVEPDAWAAPRE